MIHECDEPKPTILTHTDIRMKQITGEVSFIGRDGDRCRVRFDGGWKGYRLRGNVWVAIAATIKAGGFIS